MRYVIKYQSVNCQGTTKDMSNAEMGFRMQFSALPYPTFKQQITRMREEYGGNWYRMAETQYLVG